MPRRSDLATLQRAQLFFQSLDTWTGRLVVLLSTFLLTWLLFSFEPLMTFLSHALIFALGLPVRPGALEYGHVVLLEPLAPLLLLFPLAGWMVHTYRRRRLKKLALELVPPEPHRALIFLLSPFFGHNRTTSEVAAAIDAPADVQALDALLNRRSPKAWQRLRDQILATNWGPLWVATEHHAAEIQHVWLVCSTDARGSFRHFPLARRIVCAAASREVACHAVTIDDPNHLAGIVEAIEEAYAAAQLELDLDVDDIIADFTGGNAAMTAALILATVDPGRKVQYLSQASPLFDPEGVALSPRQIYEHPLLLQVYTSYEVIPFPARIEHAGAPDARPAS